MQYAIAERTYQLPSIHLALQFKLRLNRRCLVQLKQAVLTGHPSDLVVTAEYYYIQALLLELESHRGLILR